SSRWMPGAIDDLLAIRGEERAPVVAGGVGQTADVRAVNVHRVHLQVAVLEGREDQHATVRRERRLGRVHAVIRETLAIAAVGPGGEEVEGIEPPDVSL